ncbi:MAG TPA: MBL fold metallo-hydrolase [Anaerolineaceae bacterium]|jgi:glyoxylase-like metal-dependent hydrolase (beta-lactamase superfamily II)
MAAKVYSFNVGDWDCTALSDGGGSRPIATLVKDVPADEVTRAMTAAGFPAADWEQGFNCLTITDGTQRILFDAGFGNFPGRPQGELSASLGAAGIAPADIDILVITHGDPDHVFGLIGPDGGLKYPGARYFVSLEAWEWYASPKALDAMQPEMAAFYRRLMPLLEPHLETVGEDRDILPGIRMVKAPGHRAGHMTVEIKSEGETLLHAADALLHPIFVRQPEWLGAIDWKAEMAAATRREIFAWAAEKDALVFTAHLSFPGLGKILRIGNGWAWQPRGAE